jgi:hypothetical protein
MLTPKVTEITRASAHTEKAGQTGPHRLRSLRSAVLTHPTIDSPAARAFPRAEGSRAAKTSLAAAELLAWR